MPLEYHNTLIMSIETGGVILSFSEKLASAMRENHITNYRLAKDIGVHQSTVKNWLVGMSPHLDCAKKVADYFGKTVDEMMK